jgi:hypothetical protein
LCADAIRGRIPSALRDGALTSTRHRRLTAAGLEAGDSAEASDHLAVVADLVPR